jgi:hypothetical protein
VGLPSRLAISAYPSPSASQLAICRRSSWVSLPPGISSPSVDPGVRSPTVHCNDWSVRIAFIDNTVATIDAKTQYNRPLQEFFVDES